MQAFVETLSATHDGAKPYTGGYGQAAPPGGWPKTTHPVVIRHPESGRKGLFVNRGFTTRINELDRKESDALLEFLWRHVETHLEFQCRVRWEPNTLVFWDNRCTQHHAVWDYYPHSRYGERVSIVGEPPSLWIRRPSPSHALRAQAPPSPSGRGLRTPLPEGEGGAHCGAMEGVRGYAAQWAGGGASGSNWPRPTISPLASTWPATWAASTA